MRDLGYSGPKFTWCNRQDPSGYVKVRLDRVVVNTDFTDCFDGCHVENIIATSSDHYAIRIGLSSFVRECEQRPVQQGFKFEAMWLRATDYKDTMEQAWAVDRSSELSLQSTWDNLQNVAASLKTWSRDSFGSVRKQISKLERRLLSIRTAPASDASIVEERNLEKNLCELFEREEIMERQRSRIDWLKEGDRNTSFFQARAKARRHTNRIQCLQRDGGSFCETQGDIKGMVQKFYDELFYSQPCDTATVLDAIPQKVSSEMNDDLCKPYSNEEIKTALFQMGPTKAPGPDGFPALFYQTHWNFLEKEICQAVRDFLDGKPIRNGFCDSSAFVPGRLITDNTLIAYECLHTIRKQRAKQPFFAMKIDMMKAYDRVEWDYLHGCLSKLGFGLMENLLIQLYPLEVSDKVTQSVLICSSCVLKGSGQLVNKDKSSLFFGKHCPKHVKQRVKKLLGISNEALNDYYLGMPTELPVDTCEKFRQIIADEWWGREDGKRKLHWRSWEWLTTPKALGGMGFRDMALFNLVMLAKQGWRLLTDPSSLCARVLKCRYFPTSNFWNAMAPRSAFATWRAILAGREILQMGVQWGIGNGEDVCILTDHWIPLFPPHRLHPLLPIPATAKVKCLIDEEAGSWNEDSVRAFFRDDVAAEILRIPISRHGGMDFLRWPFTKYGEYTEHNYNDDISPMLRVAVSVVVWRVWCMHFYSVRVQEPRESSSSNTMWTPPPPGVIVINSDAAIFSEINMSGAGVVALNHEGASRPIGNVATRRHCPSNVSIRGVLAFGIVGVGSEPAERH
nr:uncharacterized protein LOC120963597 [Aegilops tauschii subsp. strangulata]